MMRAITALLVLFLITACSESSPNSTSQTDISLPIPQRSLVGTDLNLDSAALYDKVLGALVGSAIGDAMGASTEMWHRADIQREYGYITGLTTVDLPRQAEGPWGNLLDAGATTDDTRWKYFMGKYFTRHAGALNPDHFAGTIVDYYQDQVKALGNEQLATNPDLLDDGVQKVDWIKEWARVALAYQEGGMALERARNRFYGGEMSCAGMLYTPMFGLISENAEAAYKSGYDHALFDIGYAKDISGVVAAMTRLALQEDSIELVLKQSLLIDPYGYTDSRLVGRLIQGIVDQSRQFVSSAYELPEADTSTIDEVPRGFTGTQLDWLRQDYIYGELAKNQRAIAFHAGEIFQILYTALLYSEGDFEKAMAFIVNYGRDNDTVAAVAGMILGAQIGFDRLPVDLKSTALRVNRDLLGIDLEQIAREVMNTPLLSSEAMNDRLK